MSNIEEHVYETAWSLFRRRTDIPHPTQLHIARVITQDRVSTSQDVVEEVDVQGYPSGFNYDGPMIRVNGIYGGIYKLSWITLINFEIVWGCLHPM